MLIDKFELIYLVYIYHRNQKIETLNFEGLYLGENYNITLKAWSIEKDCGKDKPGCIFKDLESLLCTTQCNPISWNSTKMPEKVLSGNFDPFRFIKYVYVFL